MCPRREGRRRGAKVPMRRTRNAGQSTVEHFAKSEGRLWPARGASGRGRRCGRGTSKTPANRAGGTTSRAHSGPPYRPPPLPADEAATLLLARRHPVRARTATLHLHARGRRTAFECLERHKAVLAIFGWRLLPSHRDHSRARPGSHPGGDRNPGAHLLWDLHRRSS